MSLKGSLQTVALPEVLHFLSSNGKSGDFHVSDGHAEGHVWFQEGRISGFQAGPAAEVFEAIFELLRIEDGEFTFAAGIECPEDAHHVTADGGDLEPAMAAAQERLKEWHEIVAVVPSAAHRVRLSDEVPHKTVRLEPQQWVMVVAIGAGHSVGEVLEAMSLREFEGFRAVRTLVDNKLVEVSEPAEADEAVIADETPVAEEAVVEYEPVVEEVAAWEHPVEDEPAAVEEPAFSGDALRFGVEPAVAEHEYAAVHFSGDQVEHDEHAADDSADRYAALRAAMVEVGEDLVPYEGQTEGDASHVYQVEAHDETDGRAALQALLSEVTDGEVDGLADRGPWSDHELSAMESDEQWGGEEQEPSNIVPFAPVHHAGVESEVTAEDGSAEAEEAEEAQPSEEPMNRGLLLKFLSSVRN